MINNKRGQVQMSFGMIFSIFLIIVFVVFAFYAIKAFLNFQDKAKAGKFYSDLQSDIDRIWRSSSSLETVDYVIPSYADYVCFFNEPGAAEGENQGLMADVERTFTDSENTAFYPVKFNDFESKELNHLDIIETTDAENPLCIKKANGKVSFILEKSPGEALVTIEKKN